MHEDLWKRPLDEQISFYEGLGLTVSFVPVREPETPLTVKCPMCGLVMLSIPNGDEYDYVCTECGILG